MQKEIGILILAILALLIAAAILLSGCVSDAQPQQGSVYRGGYNGQRGNFTGPRNFGNMTSEQRAQMMQQLASACGGKSAGDACALQVPQQGSMNGTCRQNQNGTLACGFGMGRGGNPGAGAPPAGQG